MEQIRTITESDFQSILRLNDAEIEKTSAMDRDRLVWLVGMSAYSRVTTLDGQVAAFLIALREGAAYDSDNYRWFASRLRDFLYVDRIVVDSRFSGRGIGSRLYDDLFFFARSQRISTIACEYNIDPPNPASRAFHDKFGFKELGTQWLAGGTKQVSLRVATATQA